MLLEADMTSISIADIADFIGREVPAVLLKGSEVVSTDQPLTVSGRLPLPVQQLLEKVVQ